MVVRGVAEAVEGAGPLEAQGDVGRGGRRSAALQQELAETHAVDPGELRRRPARRFDVADPVQQIRHVGLVHPGEAELALLGREVESDRLHVDVFELRVREAFLADVEDLLAALGRRVEGLELEAEELDVVPRQVVRLGNASRAGLGVEAVRERLAHRQDAPARAALGFEEDHVVTGFLEQARRAQARKARSEHDDPLRRPAPGQRLRVQGKRQCEAPEGREAEEVPPVERASSRRQNRRERQLSPPSIFWNSDMSSTRGR